MDSIGTPGTAGSAGGFSAAGSPTQRRPGTSGSMGGKRKRPGTEFESSPGSAGEDEGDDKRKHAPGVKRACNECRQQKLRCDVVQDPFTVCSRCARLKLECKIESNFKRVGKRSKHAEMEKQIDRLTAQLTQARRQGFRMEDDMDQLESPLATNGPYSNSIMNNSSYMGSDEVVSSLLHLKQGGSYERPRYIYELENVGLTEDITNRLFNEFFYNYHPFLPFLDPSQTPDQFFAQAPLLFWTIVTIAARRFTPMPDLLASITAPFTRLLWRTVGDVPSSYHVVKALCLLCTWPLPTSTTSSDPTHILNGVMMKSATGLGLHRPSHTQDFSRVSIDLNKDQLHDRVTTWAVCNIVAQSVGTGYGQPASTLYDWTLALRPGEDGPFTLSAELESRLQIERFCDKISKEMYSNASDPRGVAGDELRTMLNRVYRREYSELQVNILTRPEVSPILRLHLRAAGLHLRLSAFFDSSTTQDYMDSLLGLWRATLTFLDLVFELEATSAANMTGGYMRHATNFLLQMVVAACFTLLKLLGSFFATEVDFERGRQLFHRTIQAIRGMSITRNDLPWRLAELMVQMWNGSRVETRGRGGVSAQMDETLQLKVRCRMSMSLMFDSIWRWREEYQARGRGSIDAAIKNPTKPDSSTNSTTSSNGAPPLVTSGPSATSNPNPNPLQNGAGPTGTQLDSTLLAASNAAMTAGAAALQPGSNGGSTPSYANMGIGGGYEESNYEVFDPLNWMLDGYIDFPYSWTAVQGLEG